MTTLKHFVLLIILSTAPSLWAKSGAVLKGESLYINSLKFHMKYTLRVYADYIAERLLLAKESGSEQANEDFLSLINEQPGWNNSFISEEPMHIHAEPAHHHHRALHANADRDEEVFKVDATRDFLVISPNADQDQGEKISSVEIQILDERGGTLADLEVESSAIGLIHTGDGNEFILLESKVFEQEIKRESLLNANIARLKFNHGHSSHSVSLTDKKLKTFLSQVKPSLTERCLDLLLNH